MKDKAFSETENKTEWHKKKMDRVQSAELREFMSTSIFSEK